MSTIDWSPLPQKFRHLVPFFEVYGDLQFDDVIVQKLETMEDAELEEVRRVFKALLPVEYELNNWIDGIGITKSRAAALVYFTFHFLAIANDSGLIHDI
ncbi:unnamed protein product [Phaeothamnion confervicola]